MFGSRPVRCRRRKRRVAGSSADPANKGAGRRPPQPVTKSRQVIFYLARDGRTPGRRHRGVILAGTDIRDTQVPESTARTDYDTAIRLQPDHANAFINRGILRAAQGDPAGARADFDTAARLKHKS